jgi:hypothetical protein
MRSFAKGDLDGVFFVGLAPTMVSLVQLERDVGLWGELDTVALSRNQTTTHAVIQLGNPSIRNWQAGEQDEVYQCVYMAFLGEVKSASTLAIVASCFKIGYDIPKQR